MQQFKLQQVFTHSVVTFVCAHSAPASAAETYSRAAETFPGDTHLLLGAARVHDQMNEMEMGTAVYRKVLLLDASNVEAIACLASHHFYGDQPELALKYYRYGTHMLFLKAHVIVNALFSLFTPDCPCRVQLYHTKHSVSKSP